MSGARSSAASPSPPPLEELFGAAGQAPAVVQKPFRVLRRQNQVLLALPPVAAEAVAALDLYAPQKWTARGAVRALRWLLRAGLPVPLSTGLQPIDPAAPLAAFCTELAPSWLRARGGLGVLAGNPRAAGRRFVLMLFEAGHARAVVKAGTGGPAQERIATESAFLSRAARPGIAPPLAELRSAQVSAFAMAPLAGEAPRQAGDGDLQRVLLPWLDHSARRPLASIAGWARVASACGDWPAWRLHCAPAQEQCVSPTIGHGDFAPWNIKVHPRSGLWQVFDWEAGELQAVPGWDWLHYLIQEAILVRGLSAPLLRAHLERRMAGAEFHAYLQEAGLTGQGRAVLVSYLLHRVALQPPTEGLASLQELLHAFSPP